MCGRFSTTAGLDSLLELLGVDGAGTPLAEIIEARANIAPSEPIAVVANRPADAAHPRQVELFDWGLVPFWTKPTGAKGPRPFNIRAESLLERPGFHSLIARHRAIVPVAGFYEWKKPPAGAKNAKKTPYFIRRADGTPMALAAVWETRKDAETGARLHSCAIVTTEPNEEVREIHDRMPVILEPRDFERWLAANEVEPAALRDVLRAPPDGALVSERLETSPGAAPKRAAATKQLGLFADAPFTSRKGSRYSRP